MQTRKNIALWLLYDFANSILSIVFFLYFAQWIVIDKGFSDLSFNLTFTLSALLLLITAPILGSILDNRLRRIVGLRYTTVGTLLGYGTCALFAINDSALASLVAYTLGLYCYLLSFSCYTPLINDITPKPKRGFISGLGIAANYFGQIAGLLLVLVFASGKATIFNSSPRAETLLPAVAIFGILALPMLLAFKEPHKTFEKNDKRKTIRETLHETRELLKTPGVGLFLLAYFLFNDAILTASNNFPIFLEQVWQLPDTTKTVILLGILLTAAIGGIIAGHVADRYGHKKTLTIVLLGWLGILPLVAYITNFALFVAATTIMGLWFGANWAVSRSVMSYLAPEKKHNLAFSYFGIAERASSLVGPIVWGLSLALLSSLDETRYRITTLIITTFIALGLLVLTRVRSDKNE
jgi:MFS transporter, UMF1 family